ncbi:MAG: hypothetical protein Q4E59_06170 [Bacteroidales bacterium]|nr:hypothetical protein [Bacteroidales bacterium]
MKENVVKVLRWIAVPFAAVIGGLLGYALFFLWMMITESGDGIIVSGDGTPSLNQILSQMLGHTVSGATFVWAGTLTAPHARRVTSIVLAVIISMFIVCETISIIGAPLMWYVSTYFTIIGAIWSSVHICKKEKEHELR